LIFNHLRKAPSRPILNEQQKQKQQKNKKLAAD
jgi:hypothetical protein